MAHAQSAHLSPVVKFHNKIIYTVAKVLKTSAFTENSQHMQKLTNMRCEIKMCKHIIIVMAVPSVAISSVNLE